VKHAPLAALLFAAGCSGLSTTTDYDPATDFSKLKSWAWFEAGPPNANVDTLTDTRIRGAVEAELVGKGLRKVDSGTPDFAVKYHAAVQQKVEHRPTTVSVGYGWRYGHVGVSSSDVNVYSEGTLVVDFIHLQKKELLWRGTVSGAVEPQRSPQERTARIQEAVAKMLAQFPPK